jgi:hypothetical protein
MYQTTRADHAKTQKGKLRLKGLQPEACQVAHMQPPRLHCQLAEHGPQDQSLQPFSWSLLSQPQQHPSFPAATASPPCQQCGSCSKGAFSICAQPKARAVNTLGWSRNTKPPLQGRTGVRHSLPPKCGITPHLMNLHNAPPHEHAPNPSQGSPLGRQGMQGCS